MTETRVVPASLASLITDHAEDHEASSCLSDEVAAALVESGIVHAMTPAAVGGGEVHPVEACELVEEVACLDGSIGWTLMAAMTSTAFMGAYLADDAVDQIFSGNRAVGAGQNASTGKAVRVDGGYQISGRYSFGTATHHADWIFGGYRELDGDEPVMLPIGVPNVLAMVVPRSEVEFLGNWDVMGLRGTGSYDYAVPEQVVAPGFGFSLFDARTLRGGPQFDLGPFGLSVVGHAGFAIGVGRRALDEIAALAHNKKRAGRGRLVEDPTFQLEYGRMEAALHSARASAMSVLAELYDAAVAGEIDARSRARARLAATHAVEVAEAVVNFAYRSAGSASLRNPNVIQRCFRDLHAGTQHIFTDTKSITDASQVMLGLADPELAAAGIIGPPRRETASRVRAVAGGA